MLEMEVYSAALGSCVVAAEWKTRVRGCYKERIRWREWNVFRVILNGDCLGFI